MNKNSTDWVAVVWPGVKAEEGQALGGGREGVVVEPRPVEGEWDGERWDGLG